MSAPFEEAELSSLTFPLTLRRPTRFRAMLVRQVIAWIAAPLLWVELMFSPTHLPGEDISWLVGPRGEIGDASDAAGTSAKKSPAMRSIVMAAAAPVLWEARKAVSERKLSSGKSLMSEPFFRLRSDS